MFFGEDSWMLLPAARGYYNSYLIIYPLSAMIGGMICGMISTHIYRSLCGGFRNRFDELLVKFVLWVVFGLILNWAFFTGAVFYILITFVLLF
jgi:hypothetical protein